MYAVLKGAGNKTLRVLPSVFHKSADRKYKANIKILRNTANKVLQSRKKEGGTSGRKDLLTAMLNGVDPVTGAKMTDESIIDNLIKFLVVGHETTAATFTFTIYQLLKHPEVYRKVQQEVDNVIGKGPILVEHVRKLKYFSAVIREVLRLSAPIPAFAREAIKDETIGGKYKVKAGEQIICMLSKSHLDPAVFGDTAEEFEPERMMDDNFDRLMKEFPHCWAPFGTGMRGCIGRAFAWQEMILALALLMQNFNFVMDNPSYALQISQTLTIKPKDFKVRAILREGLTPTLLESRLAGSFHGHIAGAGPKTKSGSQDNEGNGSSSSLGSTSGAKANRMAVFYGSNAGTCEFMAQRMASDAAARGFKATVDSLDAAREALPTDGPVIIITASYEGQPPHNAAHFVDWIENLKDTPFKDVSYAVYGCGHADWVKTYQRILKLVHSKLEELGAHPIAPMESTNAKDRDMFTDFETWEEKVLWPALAQQFGSSTGDEDAETGLSVSFSTPRTLTLRQDVKEAVVLEARFLEPGQVTGSDYLAVLPHNPKDSVARVMRHFHLAWDCYITIAASSPTTLPTDISIPVAEVLNSCVELNQPATKRNIQGLCELAKDDNLRQKIKQYGIDSFDSELNILFPTCKPRRSVLNLQHSQQGRLVRKGSTPRRHNIISFIPCRGRENTVSVRKAAGSFRLPVDMDKIPIICVAAGTGIAPFRAFIQERAILRNSGRTLAPAVLFLGCRDPGVDDLYREEFDEWETAGAVTMFRAYSGNSAASLGCKYVQDRIWRERNLLAELWQKNARIFVCGSNVMADIVKDVIFRVVMEQRKQQGELLNEEEVTAWFESVRNKRYAIDVFN
ncbi:cytochrome P450 monooxygenase [Fusarium bulbicola]|nr:cytochrome P450 monooxygenase [Fusarium bulbicola]